MPLEKEALGELSGGSVQDIKDVLDELEAEDIAKLYDMEVAKSQPRKGVTDLLLGLIGDDEEEESEPADPNAFVTSKPYSMVWEDGTKCILQNNKLYDEVTKKLVRKLTDKESGKAKK